MLHPSYTHPDIPFNLAYPLVRAQAIASKSRIREAMREVLGEYQGTIGNNDTAERLRETEETLNTVLEQLTGTQDELSDTQDTLRRIRDLVEDMEDTLREALDQVGRLQQINERLSNAARVAMQLLTDRNRDNDALQDALRQARDQMHLRDNHLAQVRAALRRTTADLDRARQTIGDRDNTIQQLQQDLIRHQDIIREDAAIFTAVVNDFFEIVERDTIQITGIQYALDQALAELDNRDAALARCQRTENMLRNELRRCNENLEQVQLRLRNANLQGYNRGNDFQRQLDEFQRQYEVLLEHHRRQAQRIRQLTEERDKALADIQDLRRQIEALNQGQEEAGQRAREALSQAEQERDHARQLLAAARGVHQTELEELRDQRRRMMRELVQQHLQDQASLQDEHDRALENCQRRCNEEKALDQARRMQEMQELRGKHHKALEELRGKHEQSMQNLRDTHEQSMQNLRDTHERSMQNLRDTHQREIATLKEENFKIVQDTIQEQGAKVRGQAAALANLEAQAERLSGQLAKCLDENSENSKAAVKRLNERLTEVNKEFQACNEALKECRRELEDRTRKCEQLEERLAELERNPGDPNSNPSSPPSSPSQRSQHSTSSPPPSPPGPPQLPEQEWYRQRLDGDVADENTLLKMIGRDAYVGADRGSLMGHLSAMNSPNIRFRAMPLGRPKRANSKDPVYHHDWTNTTMHDTFQRLRAQLIPREFTNDTERRNARLRLYRLFLLVLQNEGIVLKDNPQPAIYEGVHQAPPPPPGANGAFNLSKLFVWL